MKIILFVLTLSTQTFAFETTTECPMMRESHQRVQSKQIKEKVFKQNTKKDKASVQ